MPGSLPFCSRSVFRQCHLNPPNKHKQAEARRISVFPRRIYDAGASDWLLAGWHVRDPCQDIDIIAESAADPRCM